MKITIEDFYGRDYILTNVPNDSSWEDLREQFARLGVMMGYSPTIIKEKD